MSKTVDGNSAVYPGVRSDASQFLRRVLWTDAIASGISAVLAFEGAAWLEPQLGLPQNLLRNAALVLVPFVALVVVAATRVPISRGLVWAVIAINLIWLVDSVALLFTGWISPTPLGYAVVLLQAAGVGLLAELEYLGLRRTLT